MKKLTIEDVKSYGHYLDLGKLRRFIESNKDLPDETKVLVERVKDYFFEKGNWGVYPVEGYLYHSVLRTNKNMREEIERRARGEEPNYSIEDPSTCIVSEEELEAVKDQFHPAWCISKDENFVLIYQHY